MEGKFLWSNHCSWGPPPLSIHLLNCGLQPLSVSSKTPQLMDNLNDSIKV